MKATYESPIVEIVEFIAADVIATSDPTATIIPGLPDDIFGEL